MQQDLSLICILCNSYFERVASSKTCSVYTGSKFTPWYIDSLHLLSGCGNQIRFYSIWTNGQKYYKLLPLSICSTTWTVAYSDRLVQPFCQTERLSISIHKPLQFVFSIPICYKNIKALLGGLVFLIQYFVSHTYFSSYKEILRLSQLHGQVLPWWFGLYDHCH